MGGEPIAGAPAVESEKDEAPKHSNEYTLSRKTHLLKGTHSSYLITGSPKLLGEDGGANARIERCSPSVSSLR